MALTIPMLDSNEIANQLQKAMGLSPDPVVRNQWFNNQEITIDGWHFISCRFDNCQIYVGSPKFKLENCFIDEKSQLIINNEASNIVRLFHLRNKFMIDNHPFYAPRFNADGTFSIGSI